MEEQWKPIIGLKHQMRMRTSYEVSNLGRIRNASSKRIIKPHKHNSGYLSFHYRHYDENGCERFGAMLWHRVVALAWIPNPDNLPQIDHIDRDVTNNSINNLRWVSARDNA